MREPNVHDFFVVAWGGDLGECPPMYLTVEAATKEAERLAARGKDAIVMRVSKVAEFTAHGPDPRGFSGGAWKGHADWCSRAFIDADEECDCGFDAKTYAR